MSHRQKNILVVVAVPATIRAFLLIYLKRLASSYRVTVACADTDTELLKVLPEGVTFQPVNIRREIALFSDIRALVNMIGLMRTGKYDMVHSVTPKAGLICQLAAAWCGIGIRVHTFTGQIWVTKRGAFRWLLKMLDCLIAACATRLLTDSASQRDFLIAEGVVPATKIEVLCSGSISGVDVQRFSPNPGVRLTVRAKLGYSDNDVLALFVGRLNRDKGVLDLAAAFARVSSRLPQLALLLVGPDEESLASEITDISGGNPRLRLLGSTTQPESFMMAADFFCLSSYREGFGSVIIEAAACGIPALASAIYGLTDAVDDGRSGVLHPPKDIGAIAQLLEKFTIEREWREHLGFQARQRALADFSAEVVADAQIAFVSQQMAARAGGGKA